VLPTYYEMLFTGITTSAVMYDLIALTRCCKLINFLYLITNIFGTDRHTKIT